MSEQLLALLEQMRNVQMTPEEVAEQRISFAYGNENYEDSRVTREDIVRASQILQEHASQAPAQ